MGILHRQHREVSLFTLGRTTHNSSRLAPYIMTMPRPSIRTQWRNQMLEHGADSCTVRTRFWRWLCLFAFRHWTTGSRGRPVGIPFERDPLMPCTGYNPRPPSAQIHGRCAFPDGHYLCDRCAERPVQILTIAAQSSLPLPTTEHAT